MGRVVQPVQFTQMHAAQMHFCRALFHGRRYGYLAVGDLRYRISPVWPPPSVPNAVVFHLYFAEMPGWVAIDNRIITQLLDDQYETLISGALPLAIQAIAIERLAGPILDYFERCIGQTIEIRRVVSEPLPAVTLKHYVSCGLHIDVADGSRGKAEIYLPEGLADVFVDAFPIDKQRDSFFAMPDDFICEGKIIFAEISITAKDLYEIEIGDVCILANKDQYNLCLIFGSDIIFTAKVVSEGLLIEKKGYAFMPENEEKNEVNINRTDQLPIQLVFELGRLQLNLGELQRLSQGYIIPLSRDLQAPVDILANGRRIGKGQILDVDGQVAVRITQLPE